VSQLKPLAFVDIETTGLSPSANRIAEIGVITVDGNRIGRWTTLLRTTSHRGRRAAEHPDTDAAPVFEEIAAGLARRLSGRLMVAHNARFDHAFLRAEFDRVGIVLDADVLCSVMLSRKLYPQLAHHDLDSLIEHHGLRAEVRHRALPDADLLWRWWELIHKRWPNDVLRDMVSGLAAGPILPAHLAPSLIDKLPEAPGAYVFHGERNQPLCVGAAGNLKRHVLNYFRIDRATSASLEYSHLIADITYRRARGMLGARLHAATLGAIHFAGGRRKRAGSFIHLALLAGCDAPHRGRSAVGRRLCPAERFVRHLHVGTHSNERADTIGVTEPLCHCLLGVAADSAKKLCAVCADNGRRASARTDGA
jgi:DNA polymerase-3 subunit epsilon